MRSPWRLQHPPGRDSRNIKLNTVSTFGRFKWQPVLITAKRNRDKISMRVIFGIRHSLGRRTGHLDDLSSDFGNRRSFGIRIWHSCPWQWSPQPAEDRDHRRISTISVTFPPSLAVGGATDGHCLKTAFDLHRSFRSPLQAGVTPSRSFVHSTSSSHSNPHSGHGLKNLETTQGLQRHS